MRTAITYDAIMGNARKVKTAPDGRRCKYCDQLLSIYNHGTVCHAHKIKDIDKKIAKGKKKQECIYPAPLYYLTTPEG